MFAFAALARPSNTGIGRGLSRVAVEAYLLLGAFVVIIELTRVGGEGALEYAIGRYACAIAYILYALRQADQAWLARALGVFILCLGLLQAVLIMFQHYGSDAVWGLWAALNPDSVAYFQGRGDDYRRQLYPGIGLSAAQTSYHLAASAGVIMCYSPTSWWRRRARLTGLTLVLVAIILMQQRSSLLVVLLVGLLLAFRGSSRRHSAVGRRTLYTLIILLVSVYLVSTGASVLSGSRFAKVTDDARVGAAIFALRGFANSPIIGDRLMYSVDSPTAESILTPHNQFLLAMAYFGVVGLLAVTVVHVEALRRLWAVSAQRRLRSCPLDSLTVAFVALLLNGLFHNLGLVTGDILSAVTMATLTVRRSAAGTRGAR